MVEVINNN